MKSLKKTLVLLVVLSMIFSTFVPAFAATDVADLDCEDAVLRMEALDIIAGFEDGTFRPDETITRAQMAVIVCKMTGITEAAAEASKNVDSKFTDVKAGEWYTGWVNIATGNGIIAGFPDLTFRPNEVLTLNQVLTLCVKALGRGAYVDQMGTWPANYVTEAAKLGLLDDVKSNSTDANRGNVAIIAWNTMKAPCWDVNTTKLDGEVSLSDARNTTLLSTHFRNFVYEASNGNKYLKEADSFKVAKAPSMEKDLGERQIVLEYLKVTTDAGETVTEYLDKDFAKFVDAIDEEEPKRNEDVATYFDEEEEINRLVAYVPEEVCEDLEALYGKEVTVIFGEENEVALIIVTDEATIDNDFVTKYNQAEKKLTIAGTEYKILDDVAVYVNGIAFGTKIAQIEKVLEAIGVDETSTRTITKALKANVILNSKNKVERIDFTLSGNYFIDNDTETVAFVEDEDDAEYMIEEKIVKDIKSKGDVKDLDNNTLYNYEDLMEEEIEPKVLKDGKEISLDEIAEGDVLTLVTSLIDGEDIQTIYVSSNKVTGTVGNVNRNLSVVIDGTRYYASTAAIGSTTGDVEDGAEVDYDYLKNIDEEEAELYLNILGEYSAAVCETDATDGVFAMIRNVGRINHDSDDEEYVKLYVTLIDGTETSYTVKYDDKANETTTGAKTWTLDELDKDASNVTAGMVVRLKANSDRLVLVEDIEFVNASAGTTVETEDFKPTKGDIDNTDVVAVKLATDSEVNYDDKLVVAEINGEDVELDFSGAIYLNYNSDEEEVSKASKGWTTLVGKNNDTLADTKLDADTLFFVEDEDADILDVKLVCSITSDYVASDYQFAIVTDVTNDSEDGEEEITLLLATGETAVYEVKTEDVQLEEGRIDVGDFVQFKASEDKITTGTLKRVIDVVALNNVDDEVAIYDYINTTASIKATAKCDCGKLEAPETQTGVCTDDSHVEAEVNYSVLTKTIAEDVTTKDHLIFEYNEKNTSRIYYNDDVEDAERLGYVRISDDGANIFDLREMDVDTAEGVAFLTDADLEELDGERIIAIDVDPDENGAELLVVIAAK